MHIAIVPSPFVFGGGSKIGGGGSSFRKRSILSVLVLQCGSNQKFG